MSVPASRSNLHAMFFMALGIFGFAVLDALTKRLTEDYGTWQIIFLSRVVTTSLILAFVLQNHRTIAVLRSSNIRTHVGRSLLVIATTWSFFECLRYIELAYAVAVAFAAPLFMTALSGPLLKEKVGWHRWSAVLIGFVGVIVALQPGADGISYGAGLALAAAAAYALLQLWLRPLAGRETSHNIIFYTTLFSGLLAMPWALAEWRWPDTTAGCCSWPRAAPARSRRCLSSAPSARARPRSLLPSSTRR
jgi:drug/metabolite transporter (DMT)-like permease